MCPLRIQVEHTLVDGEYSAGLLEVGCWEALVVGEVLVLEMTETDHVVAAPVLIEELTTTLLIDILECGIVLEQLCVDICTDLVDELLGLS